MATTSLQTPKHISTLPSQPILITNPSHTQRLKTQDDTDDESNIFGNLRLSENFGGLSFDSEASLSLGNSNSFLRLSDTLFDEDINAPRLSDDYLYTSTTNASKGKDTETLTEVQQVASLDEQQFQMHQQQMEYMHHQRCQQIQRRPRRHHQNSHAPKAISLQQRVIDMEKRKEEDQKKVEEIKKKEIKIEEIKIEKIGEETNMEVNQELELLDWIVDITKEKKEYSMSQSILAQKHAVALQKYNLSLNNDKSKETNITSRASTTSTTSTTGTISTTSTTSITNSTRKKKSIDSPRVESPSPLKKSKIDGLIDEVYHRPKTKKIRPKTKKIKKKFKGIVIHSGCINEVGQNSTKLKSFWQQNCCYGGRKAANEKMNNDTKVSALTAVLKQDLKEDWYISK